MISFILKDKIAFVGRFNGSFVNLKSSSEFIF